MAFAALTIDINAKLANLEAGLKRAEGAISGFGTKVDSLGLAFARTFAAAGAVAAIVGIERALSATVERMADLDDAAESTGASVEALSSLLNTLSPTGVSLDQITDALGKLTRAMAGADEESSKAGEAFKLLGVSTRDAAGNLRPAEDVLDDLVVALDGYADGTNKTALVQAIFGKSGAALLPMLKDLATRQREVATVTAEQAAAAEDLQNAWRTLGTETDKLAEKLAGPIVTTLAELVKLFNEARTAGLGFFDALQASTLPDSKVAEEIDKQRIAIDRLRAARKAEQATREKNPQLQEDGTIAAIDREIETRQKAIEVLQRRLDRIQPQVDGVTPGGGVKKPNAPAPSGADPKKTPKAEKPAIDEFARSVDDRLAAALNKAIEDAEIFAATLSRLDELFFAGIISAEDYDRAIATLARTSASVGKDGVGALNKELEEQAERLRDMIDPTRAYYREIDKIRELLESGKITQVEANAATAVIYGKIDQILTTVPDKAREAEDAAKQLGLTFSSAFEDAIVGGESLRDVLDGLGKDVLRIFIRQQFTQPLAGAISKGVSGLFGGETLFDSLFGGKRELGGPVSAGVPYLVGERGRELFIPDSAGRVVANDKLGGAGVNIVNQFANGMTPMDVANAAHIAAAQAKREILESMSRRGAFARG